MAVYSNYHLRIRGPDRVQIYLLPLGSTVIGYNPTSDLFLNDRTISGEHAQIDYTPDGFMLVDRGSLNGTIWKDKDRDEPLNPHVQFPLRPNDRFQIGSYLLTFEVHDLPRNLGEIADGESPDEEQRSSRLYPYMGELPPGLAHYSLNLLQYLPAIYQPESPILAEWYALRDVYDDAPDTFLSRFLALFESVLLPIEWLIENFDFYLDVRTTPSEFLPWLESWYGWPLTANLSEARRRTLLLHAHELYALKGSRTALVKVIELCTDCTPELDDETIQDVSFTVEIKTPPGKKLDRDLVEQLIIAFKPVHTSYKLTIT